MMKEEQILREMLKKIEIEKEEAYKKSKIESLKKEIGKCYGTHTFRRTFISEHAQAVLTLGPDDEGKQKYKIVSFNFGEHQKNIQIQDNTYGSVSMWSKEITREQFDKILSYAENHLQSGFVKGINEMVSQQLCNGFEQDDKNKGKHVTSEVPHIDLENQPKLVKALLSCHFPYLIGDKLLTEPYSIELLDKFIVKETPDIYTPEFWRERYKTLCLIRRMIKK